MQSEPQKTSADAAHLAQKVAHELNSPLDGVMRFVSLAQRRAKEGHYEDIQRYLADAEFGLRRMAEILRDLTDVPGPAQDAFSQSASLAEILQQAIRTLATLAETRHVSVQLLPAHDAAVQVDVRLYQVVCNILKNAIEATPGGGHVTISANRSGHGLTIVITDSGSGIAPEHASRLFEPFFTTKSEQRGMGLGLALSREVLAKLGGNLSLQNCATQPGCQATINVPV